MLKRLHAHRAWANQRIIEWYLRLPQLDEYCLEMLSHILQAEEIWILRMEGKPTHDVWEPLPPGELARRSEANNAGWNMILESNLSVPFRYRRLDGEESESL